MLFHTPAYLLLLLPLLILGTRLLRPATARLGLLLGASWLFYSGGEPIFVWLLLISSLTDYLVAIRLHSATGQLRRRLWLLVSLLVNLGLLGFFKYGAWIVGGLSARWAVPGWGSELVALLEQLVLPAGISFYTFQSLAYTIDVYRGKVAPERSLIAFCTYLAYLPQLIAGPIERFNHLMPQLRAFAQRELRPQWSTGLDRISLGLAQKLILADGCGYLVDRLLAVPGDPGLLTSWAIAVGFGMQIYFDFAAYCHIAIGTSLLLGIRLAENFLAPYQAISIRDFWRRWHVTLSSWFRDYLYIPMGGSRAGGVRTLFNLLITFLLCGLWHGAGFNFLIWGALHGVMLGGQHLLDRWLPGPRLPAWLAIPSTFLLVTIAWVPFRVEGVNDMVSIWAGMAGLHGWRGEGAVVANGDLLLLVAIAIGTMLIPHAARRWPGAAGRWESAALAAIATAALLSSPTITRFIYFQF